jgi:Ca2+-binding RTX toxin-like protein
MIKTLFAALTLVLALPFAASAATVTADIERRQGTPFGPVTFTAAPGEMNVVSVEATNRGMRFHDLNALTARGDCEQVNARTALCPFSEDIATLRLGNLGDRAKVEGLVRVLGGSGFDVLRGSSGADILNGQGGGDVLRGLDDDDFLTGGRGEDALFGGGGDDDLIDGESDRRAATDIYRGGPSRDTAGADRGDQIFYTKRDRALNIDLLRGKNPNLPGSVMKGAEGDDIQGLESVAGGSGDDRLRGDGDDNQLEGNGGDDLLNGRSGNDIVMGGNGVDRLKGDTGGDVLWGDGGDDALLSAGRQDDLIILSDEHAEVASCGSGSDTVRATRLDTVGSDCELASSGSLHVRVQPAINGNEATFRVACQRLGGCSGTLTLIGPNGEDFGSGSFSDLPDDPQTFSDVSVALTPAAVEALQTSVVVQVAHGSEGGYRALMPR